jgi:pectate lyase
VIAVALLGACAAPPAAVRAPALAFPGAEGAGRHALGGRGGRVYTVTQLGDGGPGSLREAVEAGGPRTVVFAVSGTIVLQRLLRVTQGRLTIAGQTAPGDGITLRGHPFEVAADDVVVRYIRSRLGDQTGVDGDAIGIIAGRRIILDHVSASWSTDEALSISARFDTPERSFDEVTVQWSVISEALDRTAVKAPHGHGFGTLLRAAKGARVSMHHNLWAHHADRMPRPGNWHKPDVDPVGPQFDFRNNVFYDWGRERAGYNLDTATRSTYNFVNNAYLSGPSSKGQLAFEESSPVAQAWFEGNAMDGVIPADPYSLVRAHARHLPQGLPAGYRLQRPADVGPVRTDSAAQALELVLADAGASKLRDAVDLRVIDQVRRRGGGIIDSQQQVGGWPALRSAPAAPDSDGDGMPDDWERAHGLDPHDAADGARLRRGSRWTELEHYLDSLVPARVRR